MVGSANRIIFDFLNIFAKTLSVFLLLPHRIGRDQGRQRVSYDVNNQSMRVEDEDFMRMLDARGHPQVVTMGHNTSHCPRERNGVQGRQGSRSQRGR